MRVPQVSWLEVWSDPNKETLLPDTSPTDTHPIESYTQPDDKTGIYLTRLFHDTLPQTTLLWTDNNTTVGDLLLAEQALLGDTHKDLVLQDHLGSTLEPRHPLEHQFTTTSNVAEANTRITIEAICAHQSKYVSLAYGTRLFHFSHTLHMPHGKTWKANTSPQTTSSARIQLSMPTRLRTWTYRSTFPSEACGPTAPPLNTRTGHWPRLTALSPPSKPLDPTKGRSHTPSHWQTSAHQHVHGQPIA